MNRRTFLKAIGLAIAAPGAVVVPRGVSLGAAVKATSPVPETSLLGKGDLGLWHHEMVMRDVMLAVAGWGHSK